MTEPKKPQAVSLAALLRALSEPRIGAYRIGHDEPLAVVLGRYRWNIALGQAFWPALHLIEVTLRNNLHRVLSQHYGTDAWYEREPPILVQMARDDIQRARVRLVEQQKPVEPGRLIAELGFGFWTGLLGTDYEQRFWPRLLSSAFPHMPRQLRTRANVARRFHEIRQIRNRISHHEPIFRQSSLAQRYDDLHEAIGWLSPSVLHMLPIGESFHEILRRGSAPYEFAVGDLPESSR